MRPRTGWTLIGTIGVLALLAMSYGCAPATNRSSVQYAENDLDTFFEEGAKRTPTVKTLYAVARLLVAQGKDGEGEFVLKKIIEERPHFAPAYSDLAELYMRHRRLTDAVDILQAGLRVAPRDAVLLNNLGMCRLMSGDYESALASFTEATSISPYDFRFQANMATALGMLGRYEEALHLYQQVVTPADAHFNLAVICEALGDTERAAEEHHRAEALRLAEAPYGTVSEVGSSTSTEGGNP